MAGKKKKKKGLLLILLVLLLIALGGVYAGVTIYQKQQAEKEAENAGKDSIQLLELDAATVDTLELQMPEGSLNLKYNAEEETWINTDDEEMPMYHTRLKLIATNICSLTAKMKVEDTMANAANFGLDDPEYHFVLTDIEGKKTEGSIGIQNTLNGYYYFNLTGSDEVYMISSSLPNSMNHNTYYYVQCDSYEPIGDFAAITSYTIHNENMQTTFTKHPNGLPEVAYYGFTWYYEQDGTTKVSDPEYTSSYLETLTAITVSDCVNYKADADELASYGITEDSYSFNIHTKYEKAVETEEGSTEGEKPETVTVEKDHLYLIGNPVDKEKTSYYVALGDSGKVFTMDATHVDAILNARYSDFVNMEISLISIDAVTSMKVTTEEKEYEFFIERTTVEEDGESEEVATYFYGKDEMEEDTFKDLYMRLIAIWGDRGITEEDELVDTDPVLTIVYNTTLKHFPVITIELRSYDNNYYQATANGSTDVLVNKNDLTVAFNALEALDAE